MKKGEKLIWGVSGMIAVFALYMGVVVYNAPTQLLPTYQVESVEASRGELVYREGLCPACHKIWNLGGTKGGRMDGVGSRRDAAWLTRYLSAEVPQVILPSTQKKYYQMPSYAYLSETDRSDLVVFLMSLKARTAEELKANQP